MSTEVLKGLAEGGAPIWAIIVALSLAAFGVLARGAALVVDRLPGLLLALDRRTAIRVCLRARTPADRAAALQLVALLAPGEPMQVERPPSDQRDSGGKEESP